MFRKLILFLSLFLVVFAASAQFNAGQLTATRPTSTAPNVLMPAGKFYVDDSTFPKRRLGSNKDQVYSCFGTFTECCKADINGKCGPEVPIAEPGTAAAENLHQADDIQGTWRLNCLLSHVAYDDPIVYNFDPGRSHLHEFFGNTSTDGNTNVHNMRAFGFSTCQTGAVNKTGYWTPPLIYHCPTVKNGATLAEEAQSTAIGCDKSRDGELFGAWASNFYYKTGGINLTIAAKMQWPPVGLVMITGDPNNTIDPQPGVNTFFACNNTKLDGVTNENTHWSHVPTAADLARMDQCSNLNVGLSWPHCWDGTNLDSPDHKSHVIHNPLNPDGTDGDYYSGCENLPSNYVLIPDISISLDFGRSIKHPEVPFEQDIPFLRLSSDKPRIAGTAAGVSMHADWADGWKRTGGTFPDAPAKAAIDVILENCLRAKKECHNVVFGVPGHTTTDPATRYNWYVGY